MPAGWETTSYGTNAATFTRVNDAHSGSYAERLEVTSVKSGAARLLSDFDLGQYAPPPTVGATFDLGAYYKSTVPVIFYIYTRDQVGEWKFWTSGGPMPASPGWTTAKLFLCLDDVANIAPIHDLPALVSEAGGQRLHVIACLQDLSRARNRWGEDAADGFLSLFQTKLILTGIADSRTLEAISLALDEYDRQLVSYTLGRSRTDGFPPRAPAQRASPTTPSRHGTLPPGEIARLPAGHGLLLRGTHWGLLRLTPWYRTEPWPAVAGVSPTYAISGRSRKSHHSASRSGARASMSGALPRSAISSSRSSV